MKILITGFCLSRVRCLTVAALACCVGFPATSALAQSNSEKEHRPGNEMIVAPSADVATQDKLLDAWRGLGPDYEPRTEHLLEDGSPKYVNRLVTAASPYLLQHAHNPVDWYPWGEEAFAAAAERDVPVFLSIGYATCHWCHVMERESFENEEIAGFLNEHFVAIKVDREQHPDIDAMYMTAVQMISGGGGWPMSSFLDTQGRPFFGGTYFPPDRFLDLLDRVSYAWVTQHDQLLAEADSLQDAVTKANQLSESVREVGINEVKLAREMLVRRSDSVNGGFGRAPKFPQESTLLFLLDQARRADGTSSLEAVDDALQKMAAGGIHDQIGGGFHRYAVDAAWQVPHFEKMLYNQAGLARAYAIGYQLMGNADYAATTRDILDYVLREMTNEEGTFYSATDADSEGREGAYFVWTEEQLTDALPEAEDAALAAALFGIDAVGNFETHVNPGETVLHRPAPLETVAKRFDMSPDELLSRRAELAERMRLAREEREPPLLDNKVLTGWNGLMITAFAEAARALDEPRYLQAAQRAADSLWDTAWDPDKLFLQRARFQGTTSIEARQTDYAWLAEAMLALYDVHGDKRWLERASALADTMIDHFKDEQSGGFFLGGDSVAGAALPTRPKDISDASTPSGNGVALRVFVHLFARTGDARWQAEAESLIDALSGTLAEHSGGMSALLTGLAEHVDGERGSLRHIARGTVRAEARRVDSDTVEVELTMAEGWHVNAQQPLQDYLIGTRLSGEAGKPLSMVKYPKPVIRTLSFQRAQLALYEGRVRLSADLPEEASARLPRHIELRLQACSDKICLAPETVVLEVPRTPS